VNSEGKIYQGRTVNNVWDWDPRPGCAKDIGVGANGVPWIIGCDRVSSGYSIYKWAHPERSDPWERQPGGGSEISVAADGRPWIVNNAHNIYRRADP
jgi:hypothetical protein